MKGFIQAIITIIFLLLGFNFGLEFIHKEVREATIKKLSKGLMPLSPATQKMTGMRWAPVEPKKKTGNQ